ncbi:hypothetical protein [Paenibacillus sp. KN14-4R]|uniref:hypothetical protein n=1 Tax=Paenibacillus sp. KN14-4R TaxID=3445773 RepID=UPI003FA00F88
MKKRAFLVLITTLAFISLLGCSDKKEIQINDLSFGGISLGYLDKQIADVLREPTSIQNIVALKKLSYEESKAEWAIFSLKDNKLITAEWFPRYAPKEKIPLTYDQIDFSQEYKTEQFSCYHTTTCNKYIFTKGTSVLEILMDWENKYIDRATLKISK